MMALAAQGAVKGLPDGTFGPNRTISVAEFCAMSIGVLPAAVPLEESVDPGEIAEARAFLEEKNPGYWANEIIMECLGHRDVTGVWGNTRAEWSGSLTRTQMTYALSNLYLTSALYDGAQLVGDRRLAPLIGDYVSAGIQDSLFEPCILWAYGDGLIGGVNADGDFNPDGTLTRAEACAVLDRLIHPDKRLEVDWDKADRLLQEAENSDYLIRLADGTDFLGKARIHYQQDSAYDYCRALEAEIGIQIFYLPEFTYKEAGMLYPSDFDTLVIDQDYFDLVLAELRTMKAAFDLYPAGFLKEVVSKKGSHATEIVLCPYSYDDIQCLGMHVYDSSDDAQKVDQIFYTGTGSAQYYSHEMGHMVMSSAAIRSGWNTTCETWEGLSTGGQSYAWPRGGLG